MTAHQLAAAHSFFNRLRSYQHDVTVLSNEALHCCSSGGNWPGILQGSNIGLLIFSIGSWNSPQEVDY